jgi:8-hydroxy-5-deazaflavin:NADPH oxidoreductase
MTVAILGAGHIGTALAQRFGARKLTFTIGTNVADALKADAIIFAIPFSAVPEATAGLDWTGKIVIDATNPSAPADIRGVSSTADVRACVPGAAVVKAFNTLPAAVLGREPVTPQGRRVLFVSGNDAKATAGVLALIKQLGFAAIDLSSVDPDGRLQQRGGPLFIVEMVLITNGNN